jgi:hypothetical protein
VPIANVVRGVEFFIRLALRYYGVAVG